ncbi:hypothetical protein PS934_03488 [Pseudomonas fluorescens]|nr:hypothetical protein PS934_03488 [Pseudomonas fluorescens]
MLAVVQPVTWYSTGMMRVNGRLQIKGRNQTLNLVIQGFLYVVS